MSNDAPFWTVTLAVGQERFGGLGLSLDEAVTNMHASIERMAEAHKAARVAALKELDRVRL